MSEITLSSIWAEGWVGPMSIDPATTIVGPFGPRVRVGTPSGDVGSRWTEDRTPRSRRPVGTCVLRRRRVGARRRTRPPRRPSPPSHPESTIRSRRAAIGQLSIRLDEEGDLLEAEGALQRSERQRVRARRRGREHPGIRDPERRRPPSTRSPPTRVRVASPAGSTGNLYTKSIRILHKVQRS